MYKRQRKFGAEGIGLCRTEHMFFEESRIKAMREMIVAETTEDRKKALAKIEPYQQGDFEALYEAMEGDPVTIRFLDPPLHEFLPTKEEDIKEIADELGITVAKLKEVIASLHEFNPMMGHRGCRLAVSYPEAGLDELTGEDRIGQRGGEQRHDVTAHLAHGLHGSLAGNGGFLTRGFRLSLIHISDNHNAPYVRDITL